MSKILLVEDDNNLREIYEARLQAEGYTIISARDGEEALVFAKSERPDLVISDVMMPKISGFEMLDILRNTEGLKQVKVIMLTALGQSDDQQRATRLGADHYLVKSQVTLEDIVKVAHQLLQDEPATPPAVPAASDPATIVPPPVTPVAPAPVLPPAPNPTVTAPSPTVINAPTDPTNTNSPTPPPTPSVSNAPVAVMPAMTTSVPAPAPVLPPAPNPTVTAPSPLVAAPSPVAPPPVVLTPTVTTPSIVTAPPSSTPTNPVSVTPPPVEPTVVATPAVPSVQVVAEVPTVSAPAPSISNVSTEASSIKKEMDDKSNDVAQSTAQEEASVEAKIEDFVTGASSIPDKPIPEQVSSDTTTNDQSLATTAPSDTPVTAPVIDPAINNQPDTPSADPVEPSLTTSAADSDSDDKVMANAVNTLIADTQKDNTQPAAPSIISVNPTMSSPSAPAEQPSTSIDTVPAPDTSHPGSVPIAHKKIISPVDSVPKQDLNTLLALEAAKETPVVPPAPAVVMGTDAEGQQTGATTQTVSTPPPAVPPPLPGIATQPPAPTSDNPLDPNSIAL